MTGPEKPSSGRAPVQQNSTLGIGYGALAGASLQGMNTCVRFAALHVHAFEVAFFRYLIGFILLLPLLLRSGRGGLKTDRIGMHTVRAMFNIISLVTGFWGVTMVPLAKFTAIYFTAPLFATLGALLFLGEALKIRRQMALLVGFIGVLIVLRPGMDNVGLGELLGVISAATWATSLLFMKVLTRTDSPVTITLYGTLLQLPMALVIAMFFWTWPRVEVLGWLVGVAAFATFAQLILARAFRVADASLVVSVDFLKLIWASLIGYFIFHEIPTLATWLGGAVIFLAVAYIAYRERAIAKGSS